MFRISTHPQVLFDSIFNSLFCSFNCTELNFLSQQTLPIKTTKVRFKCSKMCRDPPKRWKGRLGHSSRVPVTPTALKLKLPTETCLSQYVSTAPSKSPFYISCYGVACNWEVPNILVEAAATGLTPNSTVHFLLSFYFLKEEICIELQVSGFFIVMLLHFIVLL